MAINISISNSAINGRSKVLGDVRIKGATDIDVNIDNLMVNDNAELLNRLEILDDTHITELVKEIEKEVVQSEKNGKEYEIVQQMIEKINIANQSKRSIIKEYIPELLVGTLANVIGAYLSRL
ncbi:hypothetical protein [Roseburia inulinivorans]|uniref:Uncharacterized protein n=1 Tax=Roseburia inulinivorans TaxID=360807 RepID=A0A173XPZ1_9FIRM|nr:hypothetical protein [Roseburia inulinivorans]CUN53794.1 Uncharacterised protein [Roseburia inulinivorans]